MIHTIFLSILLLMLQMQRSLAFATIGARILTRVNNYSSKPFILGAVTGTGDDTVVSRCTQKITDALSPTRLKVSAAHDDPNGSHIAIECVSAMFEGKPAVMRQRLIYKAIWDEMADGGSVHAVDQIIAKTPAEDNK